MVLVWWFQNNVEKYSNPANLSYERGAPASDYHVNYPFDAHPDQFGTGNQFQVKLPYDNLETRHYRQMWRSKTQPKCAENEGCKSGPGYYKSYDGYFDHPGKLKDFQLGYSVTGFPYNDHVFKHTKSEKQSDVDVRQPKNKYDYPEWYNYDQPRPEAFYYGYPFNYGGKVMR